MFNRLVDEKPFAADKTMLDIALALENEVGNGFRVGQRIQFYRKDANDATLTLKGNIIRIDTKTGWLTVEHRHGTAVIKPEREKFQVLQEKASKETDELTDHEDVKAEYGYVAVGARTGRFSASGNGPNPTNIKRSK